MLEGRDGSEKTGLGKVVFLLRKWLKGSGPASVARSGPDTRGAASQEAGEATSLGEPAVSLPVVGWPSSLPPPYTTSSPVPVSIMSSRPVVLRQESVLSTVSTSPDILEKTPQANHFTLQPPPTQRHCNRSVSQIHNPCYSPDALSGTTAYTYTSEYTDFSESHSSSYYPSKKQLRRWTLMMGCMFVFFLACTSLTLTLCIAGPLHRHFSGSGDGSVELLTSDILCQPCEDFIFSDNPVDDHTGDFHKKFEHGVELCCAKNRTQFQEMLNLVAERNAWKSAVSAPQPRYGLPGNLTSNTVYDAFHVYLESKGDHCTNPDHEITLKNWSDSDETSFIRPGIVFDEEKGRFIVSRYGIYMIYYQLVFHSTSHHQSGSSDSDNFNTYSIKVKRHSRYAPSSSPGRTILEDTRRAYCDMTRSGTPCFTSSRMAQQRLHVGDEIYIEVNKCTLLKADRKSSYFGMYRIGS